jgi:transcription factor TFB2
MADDLVREALVSLPKVDAARMFRGYAPQNESRQSFLAAAAGGASAACVLRLLSTAAANIALRLTVSLRVPNGGVDDGGAAATRGDDGDCVSVSGVIMPWLSGGRGSGTRQAQLLRARSVLGELLDLHVLEEAPTPSEKERVLAVDDAEMADDAEVAAALRGQPEYVRLQSDFHRRTWSLVFDREDAASVSSAPMCAVWPRSKRPDKRQPTPDQLETFVAQTWDNILHFLIGSSQDSGGTNSGRELPTTLLVELMLAFELMSPAGDEGELLIVNSRGFQFLLKDRSSQLWSLLLEYSRTKATPTLSTGDILSLLFQVSELHVGLDFDHDSCSTEQKQVLDDLCGFGLLWKRSTKSNRFYVTSLVSLLRVAIVQTDAVTARDDAGAASVQDDDSALVPSDDNGFVVVETNFRVYAYTNSQLQLSLLSLFMKVIYRNPGQTMGLITRESAREAFRHGITAAQIIEFLRQHMHPRARAVAALTRSPVVPENVADQLLLWEAERNRVTAVRGLLLHQFETSEFFLLSLQYARDCNVLLWPLDPPRSEVPAEDRRMFVSEDGKGLMQKFLKENKPG